VLLFLLNLSLAYVMFTSLLSILENAYNKDLHLFALEAMTPACTSDTLCKDGNVDVDKPSLPYHPSALADVRSFSYVIASDPQLNWYNGESRHIGGLNYPPPCTSSDSCWSCTDKLGAYTNAQMKRTMEKLIRGGENFSSRPVPKTLVMNGDLTAYYHRGQKLEYEQLYHNIQGLQEYFPGLGNHDYSIRDGGFNGDEWFNPRQCNSKHAIGYLKSGFCQKVPNFNAKRRVTRYDSGSLAYSWEEGPYHFVHLHLYPTYENAHFGITNSLRWLEKDLNLATEMNLTSILFVHSAGDLSKLLEKILTKNKVAAIFAGHLHRCFGKKCGGLRSLRKSEVDQILNETGLAVGLEKCFPASAALCGGNVNRELEWDVFSLNDTDTNLTLPPVTLYNYVPPPKLDETCPVYEDYTYINTTDNTLVCKKANFVTPHFGTNETCPVYEDYTYINTTDNTLLCEKANFVTPHFGTNEEIPIFWSGASSFETFILADFYHDHFVLNFITAAEGHEGARYVDVNRVPNAVYPLHEVSDLDEVIIFI